MGQAIKIKRFYFDKLVEERYRYEASILIGPRQVGKTTLLLDLKRQFESENQSVLYLNLENPLDLQKLPSDESSLIRFLMDYQVILIDELYYIENISRIFKIIVDTSKQNSPEGTFVKIYASGSSAIDIHTHLHESLAGRRLITQIFPLTFSEFKLAFPQKSNAVLLEDFLTYGGLPGLLSVHSTEKTRLLREMLETYIQKDVKSLVREENIRAYNHLLVLLAQQQGQLISIHSLSKEIGLNSGTTEKYLSILEKTFVIYRLHSYSKNLANELKKSQKIYFYDFGIRNIILQNFQSASERDDYGLALESFVLTEMMTSCLPEVQIRFWRTRNQQEIDFIVVKNQIPHPIEVKKQYQNHLSNLKKTFSSFFTHYPDAPYGTIVSFKDNESSALLEDRLRFCDFCEGHCHNLANS
jgi:predicted AAA+ superfamily ATPase